MMKIQHQYKKMMNTESKEVKTGDKVLLYFVVLTVAVVVIASVVVINKKKQKGNH